MFLILFLCVRYFSLFQALKGSDSPAVWRPQENERVQFLIAGRLNNRITSCTLLSVPASQDAPIHILRIPPATLISGQADATDSLAALYAEQGIMNHRCSGKIVCRKMPVTTMWSMMSKNQGYRLRDFRVTITLPEEYIVSTEESDYIFKLVPTKFINQIIPFIASDAECRDIGFWGKNLCWWKCLTSCLR